MTIFSFFIIEFSNHYSKGIVTGVEEPIKEEHGCIFFDDDFWNAEEWNNFYSFLIDCSHFYHQNGLMCYEHRNLNKNILLQSTRVEFVDWLSIQELEINTRYSTKDLHQDLSTNQY